MKSLKKNRILISSFSVILIIIGIPLGIYYFNFGQFPLSDDQLIWGAFSDFLNIFVSLANLIILVILTWGVFIRGQEIEKGKREEEKRDFGIAKLKYLNFLTKKSTEFSQKLIKSINDFDKEIKLVRHALPIFYVPPQNEIRILLNKINQEEHYHSYVAHFKDDDIMKVFSYFDVIYSNFEIIVEELRTTNLKHSERMIESRKILDKSIFCLTNIVNSHSLGKQLIADEDWKFYRKIYEECKGAAAKDGTNLFQHREVFYTPLKDFISRQNRASDERVKELQDYIISGLRLFSATENELKRRGQKCLKFGEEIKELLQSIEEVTGRLSEDLEGR